MAYSAGDTLVRAVMQNESGLPVDVIINDFAFQNTAGAASSTDFDEMFTLVDEFFRTDTAAGANVGEFIGNQVDRSATHLLQAYVITAGGLGSPAAEENWLGPPTSASPTVNMPSEVSGVLSFHADLTGVLEEAGATRPKARRRGRIYIGPLNGAAVNYDQAIPNLGAGFLTTIRQAGVRLIDNSAAEHPWAVWSRADAILRPVVGGWTDDAIDTTRSRGAQPTSRVTWG